MEEKSEGMKAAGGTELDLEGWIGETQDGGVTSWGMRKARVAGGRNLPKLGG